MWWMTESERQRCIQRLAEEDRDSQPVRWSWRTFAQLFKCWQPYGFCIAWGCVPSLVPCGGVARCKTVFS